MPQYLDPLRVSSVNIRCIGWGVCQVALLMSLLLGRLTDVGVVAGAGDKVVASHCVLPVIHVLLQSEDSEERKKVRRRGMRTPSLGASTSLIWPRSHPN